MDLIIHHYVVQTYPPDLTAELHRSFELLEEYTITSHEEAITDLLMTSELHDPIEVYDGVLGAIRHALRRVLHEHRIELTEEASIPQYNEWADALKRFQDLEEYETVGAWLDSSMSAEDVLLEIVAYLSTSTPSQLIDTLETFDVELVEQMRQYCTLQRERRILDRTDPVPEEAEILARLRRLQRYLGEAKAIGVQMAASGYAIGRPLALYKGLLGVLWRPSQKPDPAQTAKDFYSLILLSAEHREPAPVVYRRYSAQFLSDLNLIQQVDIELVKLSLAFEQHAEHQTTLDHTASSALDAIRALNTREAP